MDMTKYGEYEILFWLKKKEYSGTLRYNPGKIIQISFSTNNTLSDEIFKYVEIEDVKGNLVSHNKSIYFCKCSIQSNYLGSSSVYKYDILCQYAYIGNNIADIKKIKIREFYVHYLGIEDWIGNRLIKINTNDYKTQFDYQVNMYTIDEKLIDDSRNIKIINTATVPFGVQSNGEYKIVQTSIIGFKTKIVFELKNVHAIMVYFQHLLSFILQHDIGINEIYFYRKQKQGGKLTDIKINILLGFRKNQSQNRNVEPLIGYDDFLQNAGNIYLTWEKLENKHEYLSQFIRSYYDNNFVDQKLGALITLLESIHNDYFTGIKKQKKEYKDHIKTICSYIPDDMKQEVEVALSDRNSLSLSSKLLNYKEYARDKTKYCDSIKNYVRFRNCMYHGSGISEFSINDIINMNADLYYVFSNLLVRKVLK